MKTYKERTASILEKAKVQRKKRNTVRAGIGSVLCLAIILLGVNLFTPYDTTPPSMEQYAASDYYSVIEKMNILTYKAPRYRNAFEEYFLASFKQISSSAEGALTGGATNEDIGLDYIPEMDAMEPGASSSESAYPTGDKNFEDVTDNQVAGVMEGDRFKRSDDYIFYLKNWGLSAYSIDGENSKEVGFYEIPNSDGFKLIAYENEWEIFLTEDHNHVILVSSGYNSATNQTCVVLVNIDVSDPTQMKEVQRTYITGSYLSARMIDNDLLVMAHYNARWHDINFDDATTFVPQYGSLDNMKCIEADNIVMPEELSTTNYTVVCKIDATTLEAKSTGAFLSYADEVYVSTDNIYATRTFTDKYVDEHDITHSETMTEISAMNYSDDTLTSGGSIKVIGYVKDQYSLDEYEGILRVVTTTDSSTYRQRIEGHGDTYAQWMENYSSSTSASLYCVDLETWKVVASVEKFAPAGETVRSVRFDKDNAYVCTAVQLTDPVFFFDLSDLNNITYKDTGTITGYSDSLINFGDYLLGIGYGDSIATLKIELYQETETGVESVCSYEVYDCSFSTEYKSYLIDRKNMRVGLGYHDYTSETLSDCYTLLQFDGYNLIELVKEPVTGENAYKRATIIDGYIYMFGENFIVKKL